MALPNVKDVVNDPDFQGLPIDEKHKVLTAIDPDYGNLPGVEKVKVLTDLATPQNRAQLTAEKEVDEGLLGGTGAPMSREDARKLAIERMAKRAEIEGEDRIALDKAPDTITTRLLGGHFGIPKPGEENLIVKGQGAVPRALAATVGGGYTSGPARVLQDALEKTGAVSPETVDSLGVRRVAEENPGTVMTGNLVGGLIPAGKVFQGATSLGRIGKAAILGTGYGASEAVAKRGTKESVENPGEVAKEAVASGAISTILPALLEIPAGKAFLQKLLLGDLKPGSKEVIEAAKELDIPITPAQARGSNALGGVEKGLEALPTSSGTMQARREAIQEGLKTQANKMLDEHGSAQGVQTFGEELQSRLAANNAAFKNTATKLYEKFEQAIPEGTEIPLGRARGLAQDFIEREGNKEGFSNSKLITQLKTFLGDEIPAETIPGKVLSEEKTIQPDFVNEFGVSEPTKIAGKSTPDQFLPKKILPAKMDARTFLDIRSSLNDEINAAMKNEKTDVARKLGIIKNAMDQSLDDFSKNQGGDIQKTFELANGYYSKGAQIFNDRRIQRMIEKDPGSLYDMIAQPGTVNEVETLKKALGKNRFEPVKRAIMEKILANDGADVFSAQKFVTSKSKFEPETLQAVFGKDKFDEIQKFWKVADSIATNERRVGNPSGTAKNLLSPAYISGIGYLLFHNPILGAASLITPKALAKLYTSESGMKLLTEAIQTPIGSPKASQLIARLSEVSNDAKAVRDEMPNLREVEMDSNKIARRAVIEKEIQKRLNSTSRD